MTTLPASTTSTERLPAVRRVGFIGLGDQGGAIAEMIVRGGFPLDVWARRPASTEDLLRLGARAQADPAELGRRCDVVGICVLDDAGVEEVVTGTGLLSAMAAGSTLLVHSTVAPDTCRRLAARAADTGVDVLDAPVSGGRAAALRGTLSVFVGGDPEAFDRVRPVLSTFGNSVRRVGPVGTAQIVKLINNALFVANVGMARQAIQLGETLGVEPALLSELLAASSGRSAGLEVIPALFGTAWGEQARELLAKDVDLAARLVQARGSWPDAFIEAARAAITRMRKTSSEEGLT
jgi:3-hydroxyisobutyrate dehydrogenase